MFQSSDFHSQSSELSDTCVSPVQQPSLLNGITVSKEIPFSTHFTVDEEQSNYHPFQSRRQTFDECTSNMSTITSDELPCFECNSTPSPYYKRNHQHFSFSGKSNYCYNSTFQSDTFPQDMYYSNNAYGYTNQITSNPYRRCSYDSDYSAGFYTCSGESDDYYEPSYSYMNYSPDCYPSYSYYPMEGEYIKEDLSDSYYKSFPFHYTHYEKPSSFLYPSPNEGFMNPFHSVPIHNSISMKRDEQVSTSSSSPQLFHSYYDNTPSIKEDNLTSEVICSSTNKKESNQQEVVETMELHSSLPSLSKSHHKTPIKKQPPSSPDETPGNPDDIDPTINPRVFSGKKPKKNMDYSRFIINIEKVKTGEDNRLTLMLKNIPNGFTQAYMLEILDSYVKNEYDFFYMPVDFKTNCNLGFGYVSMINTSSVVHLYYALNHKRWPNTPSMKICEVNYARMQGRNDMQKLCKDWAIMQLPEKYRPVFFEKATIQKDGKEMIIMKRTKRPL